MADTLAPLKRAYDEAARALGRARRECLQAEARYTASRKYGTEDELTASRAAWGTALRVWVGALYDREAAKDALDAAVRDLAGVEAGVSP